MWTSRRLWTMWTVPPSTRILSSWMRILLLQILASCSANSTWLLSFNGKLSQVRSNVLGPILTETYLSFWMNFRSMSEAYRNKAAHVRSHMCWLVVSLSLHHHLFVCVMNLYILSSVIFVMGSTTWDESSFYNLVHQYLHILWLCILWMTINLIYYQVNPVIKWLHLSFSLPVLLLQLTIIYSMFSCVFVSVVYR